MASTAREKAANKAPSSKMRLPEEVFGTAAVVAAGLETVGVEYPNFVRAQGDGSGSGVDGTDLFARLQEAKRSRDADRESERADERALAEQDMAFIKGIDAAERARAADGEAAEREQVSAFLQKREAIQRGAATAKGAFGAGRALQAIAQARKTETGGVKRAREQLGLFKVVAKRKMADEARVDSEDGTRVVCDKGNQTLSRMGASDDTVQNACKEDVPEEDGKKKAEASAGVLEGYDDVSSEEESEEEGESST